LVSYRSTSILVAVAILGAGCQATTMSAGSARMPVLIGPVACIGCAPSPTAAPPVTGAGMLVDSSSFKYMAAAYAWSWTRVQPKIGRKTQAVPADPCSVNVHVAGLRASAFGVWALFFAMTSVEVEVHAIPMTVAGGSCYTPGVFLPPASSAPLAAPVAPGSNSEVTP
jgi:hypothetical protein